MGQTQTPPMPYGRMACKWTVWPDLFLGLHPCLAQRDARHRHSHHDRNRDSQQGEALRCHFVDFASREGLKK